MNVFPSGREHLLSLPPSHCCFSALGTVLRTWKDSVHICERVTLRLSLVGGQKEAWGVGKTLAGGTGLNAGGTG